MTWDELVIYFLTICEIEGAAALGFEIQKINVEIGFDFCLYIQINWM